VYWPGSTRIQRVATHWVLRNPSRGTMFGSMDITNPLITHVPVDSVTLKAPMAIDGITYDKLTTARGFEIIWNAELNVLLCKTPSANELVISMKDVASLDVCVEGTDATEARKVIDAFEQAGKPRTLN
jgi:hypothetical protein